MKNSERQPFEEQWQQAFQGAEAAAPSEEVWLSIDQTLTQAENAGNKKRVIFYQRLAASLLIVAASSAFIAYWKWEDASELQTKVPAVETPDSQSLNSKSINSKSLNSESLTSNPKSSVSDNAIASSENDNDPGSENSSNVLKDESRNKSNGNSKKSKRVSARRGGVFPVAENSKDEQAVKDFASADKEEVRSLADSSNLKGALIAEQTKVLTPEEEKELIKKLKGDIEEDQPEEKKSVKATWAALSFGGGSFSSSNLQYPSSFGVLDNVMAQGLSPAPPNQKAVDKPSSGVSYSVGVLFGKQLAKRWIIQTGLTYRKQESDMESNIIQFTGTEALSAEYTAADNSLYSFASPYTIHRSTEFISIPVQIGYVIVDRKFGWMVNTGASSDLFIHTTLSDKSGQYKDNSEGSSYRPVSWSGLLNTELSLKLNEHYRFALVPGVRYSITNPNKNDSGPNPLVWDIGLRFRYIFK
ncbi:MAG: PorT family protein [Cyclobacteriaceae bacterium]|nr:PorT family protein [Cyclobacteriaceae bacterium]